MPITDYHEFPNARGRVLQREATCNRCAFTTGLLPARKLPYAKAVTLLLAHAEIHAERPPTNEDR